MVDTDDETVIEKGDFAIIDFAGTVDGEAFSGGEGKGYPLEVGSGSFIPGFEDQLIGLKKDDDTDVDVTFPESYFVPELAGKQAIFKVHIQAVKHKELPELNDEYIAKYTRYKTVAEAKEDYKKRMQEAAEREAKTEYEKGGRINMIMQSAFFKLADIIPLADAVKYLKDAVEASYGMKGQNVVDMNNAAIDKGIEAIVKIDVPAAWADAKDKVETKKTGNAFIDDILVPVNRQEGDKLPVSIMARHAVPRPL